MKTIEIDDELYQFIVKQTEFIGEDASSILRRLLNMPSTDENLQHAQTSVQLSDDEQTKSEELNETTETRPQDTVFNYLNSQDLVEQRGATGRFLLILSALYRAHAKQFEKVLAIRGRDRLYFADNEATLAASGNSTKPKQIPDSPYWVMTNSNTTRKKMMLTEAANLLGYSVEDAEKIRELL